MNGDGDPREYGWTDARGQRWTHLPHGPVVRCAELSRFSAPTRAANPFCRALRRRVLWGGASTVGALAVLLGLVLGVDGWAIGVGSVAATMFWVLAVVAA